MKKKTRSGQIWKLQLKKKERQIWSRQSKAVRINSRKTLWKGRYNDAKKKPISYDAASLHGDTLSVSEAGKTASSQKGSRLVNKDATDGIVIRKEASI